MPIVVRQPPKLAGAAAWFWNAATVFQSLGRASLRTVTTRPAEAKQVVVGRARYVAAWAHRVWIRSHA